MAKNTLSTPHKNPIYMQLREILRARMDDGEYIPGAAIPSESELAQEFGVHRLTVRSASAAVGQGGWLRPVQGKGVFVMGKKLGRDLERLTGFRQTMRERNVIPDTRVMFMTRRPAGLKYGQILEMDPEAEVYYIRRLCLANDDPVSFEDIFIPCSLLSDLESVDLNVFSLFDIYKFNGIQVTRAWQTLSVTQLDAKDSRILQIKPGTVVLMFDCISRDAAGRVVEYSRSWARSDKASFTVHYQREPKQN